jgi:hypothetical protein
VLKRDCCEINLTGWPADKFTKLPIERRQDILRELSRDFATGPPGLSMDKVKNVRILAVGSLTVGAG